eukprot:2646352-Ditylum_brightwellii.AAC.1
MKCSVEVQQDSIVCWIMVEFSCGVWAFSGPLTQWGLKLDQCECFLKIVATDVPDKAHASMDRPDLFAMSAKCAQGWFETFKYVHEDGVKNSLCNRAPRARNYDRCLATSQKGHYVAQPIGRNIGSITPNLFKDRVTPV